MKEKVKKKNKNANIIDFLFSNTKIVFIKLKSVFIITPIFYYFDLQYNIQIQTNATNHTISKIISQQTLNDLG